MTNTDITITDSAGRRYTLDRDAAEVAEHVGCDFVHDIEMMTVRLLASSRTGVEAAIEAEFLALCLEGADDGCVAAWTEYASAVITYAAARAHGGREADRNALAAGTRVRITRGRFDGCVGTLCEDVADKSRVRVDMDADYTLSVYANTIEVVYDARPLTATEKFHAALEAAGYDL